MHRKCLISINSSQQYNVMIWHNIYNTESAPWLCIIPDQMERSQIWPENEKFFLQLSVQDQ
jgi:hypothetical protein